jgi:hypothetical protein
VALCGTVFESSAGETKATGTPQAAASLNK